MDGLELLDSPSWVLVHPSKVEWARDAFPGLTHQVIVEDDGGWCVELCTEELYNNIVSREDNS